MSFIESINEVYLQLGKNSAELEMMLDRLDEVYSAQSSAYDTESLSLVPGQPICVNVTNVWYRAEVLNVNEERGTVAVRLVDYGRVETVSRIDVKQLDSEFVCSSPFAFRCRLLASDCITGIYIQYMSFISFYNYICIKFNLWLFFCDIFLVKS